MKFIGNECIVCKQKFNENDDIVVCDVCGTPYHRECYTKFGKCINTEYHEKGLTFNESHKDTPDSNETTYTYNDTDNANTDTYSQSLPNYDQLIDSSKEILDRVDIDPQEEHLGVTFLEFYLYTKSLGKTKKFHQAVNNTRIAGLLTFLFPEYYLASKSMYVQAIFTYLLNFVLNAPLVMMYIYGGQDNAMGSLVASVGFKVLSIIVLLVSIGVRFMLSDKCLKMYLTRCIRHIRKLKEDFKAKNKPYRECLYSIINVRNSSNFAAVLVLGLVSNIIYSNFCFILNLILMYLG